MSLLADWFFCTEMWLSPADTHAFLDTLTVLRRPDAELPDVLDAAVALAAAPPWLQMYALRPLLTAHGRLAESAEANTDAHLDTETLPDASERPKRFPGGDRGEPAFGDAALGRHIETLCEAVLASTDHPLAAHLGRLLAAVVRDDRDARAALLNDIAKPLAEEPRKFRGTASSSPYHDLNDQIVPTITVFALAELTRRRPTSATQDWSGDNAVPFAKAAILGDYGRLALLAAVDAACRAEPQARNELWRNLWGDGRGAPQLQPDLLDGLARLWFGNPDADERPSVADLEAEAVTGEDLALWSQKIRPSETATGEFYAKLAGRTNGPWNAMAAVLWQSVLWSLAAEVDPQETAARLARWWQVPRRTPDTPTRIHVGSPTTHAAVHLTLLQQLSGSSISPVTVDDAPVSETDPEAGSAVCSPWIERWHDGWDHERRRGPAFRSGFPGASEALLRLLAAGSLSVSLLATLPAGHTDHDHLTALVFHAVDVLRDQAALISSLESGEYVGEHHLGAASVSWVWHVHSILDGVGTGTDARIDPRLLAGFAIRVLEDDSLVDLDSNEQFARLARQSIGAISTMWLRRAWVSASAIRPEHGPGRWFLGDPPDALLVLVGALDRLSLLDRHYREVKRQEGRRRKEIDKMWSQHPEHGAGKKKRSYGVALTRGMWPPDLMPAAQLLREISPADWPDPVADRWPQLDLDWYGQRNGLKRIYQGLLGAAGNDPEAVAVNTIRSERLLLSPRHELPVWRDAASDLENWTRVDSAPVTMRVLRLAALLQVPAEAGADEYHEWIEDWLDRIHATHQGAQLSLDVRAIMIRLIGLGTPDAGAVYERRLASVHGATVDAILEFGSSTPRHVEMLLDHLTAVGTLGQEATDQLRLRALETIYRQQNYRTTPTELGSASSLRRGDSDSAHRALAVRRFLADVAVPAQQTSERVPMFERIRDLWERTQLRPLLRGRRVSLVDRRRERGERVPDLLVAASVTDRFRAQEVSYLLDVISPDTGHVPGSARVHDLFRSGQYRQRMIEQLGRRSLTVYAVVAGAEDRRIWLNAGLGAPAAYVTPFGSLPLVPGDVVAAELRGRPATVVGVRQLTRPHPDPGEVRTAEVHLARPWLRVMVDGAEEGTYPRDDTAAATAVRMRWDPDLSRTFAEDDERSLTVPVIWNADLMHWVPVERSFSELIVDEPQLEGGSIRLVHAGHDLFVTRPGRMYRLAADDWQDPDAVAALLDGQVGGLILHVSRVDPGGPRVRLDGSDDRNARWLRLFNGGEHEVTVATKDASAYRVTVDPPPGFPETVVARGAEGGPRRAYVIAAPWNEFQARRAQVSVTQVPTSTVPHAQDPTSQRFGEVWDLQEGSLLTLRRIISESLGRARVLATTSVGIVVRLEADSLTLLDHHLVGKGATGLVNGRSVEVVRVYCPRQPRPNGPAISNEELAGRVHTNGADPGNVRRTVALAETAEGVIVTRASLKGRGEDTIYGAWCRFGRDVHYVELDQESLGATTVELVGQTFTGSRSGSSWTFRFAPRDVTVRALFELVEADTEDTDSDLFVGHDGSTDVYQRMWQPVLVLRRTVVGSDPVRRLDLNAADVTLIDNRTVSVRTVAVRSRATKATLLGGSSFTGNHADAEVRGVRLQLSPSRTARHDLVQARRTFLLSARTAPTIRPARRVDHAERWRRFQSTGQEHVTGTVGVTHVDIAGGLRPPGPDGSYSARLPLLPGEEPAVAGVPYLKSGARVRLVPHGKGHVASYTTAVPKSVTEFMHLMHKEVTEDGIGQAFDNALHYVGPPTADLDAHVFEWGYGWTVAVPPDRLQVAGSPARSGLPPLFHGDRVAAAGFVAAPDGGQPVMVIAWRDVFPRYVTQIVEERRLQYLHLLEIEVGLDTGTLRVMRAQTGRGRGEEPFRSADWVAFPAALDDQSRELVFQRLREAGESGLVRRRILARFDNDTAIATGGRQRLFRAVRADGVGLRDRDLVFLTARQVEVSPNERTVIFGIPDALNTDGLAVRVNRREFSHRESTLKRLVAHGLNVEETEIVMLVRVITSSGEDAWRGSVRDVPARDPETLTSYLGSRSGPCYAVFGRGKDGIGRLEIAPGILYSAIGVSGTESAAPGAVVQLVLDAERRVVLTTAIPADESYVKAQGRPAVVLPKSNLLRKQTAARGVMQRAFVVSGLPDVQASPIDGAGPAVLQVPHPKICWVWQLGDGRSRLRLPSPGEVRIARVTKPLHDQPAALRPRALPGAQPDSPVTELPWARMSFCNVSAFSIAAACKRYAWHHHDSRTGHLSGQQVVGPYKVQPGTVMSDGVFFDDDAGWTLRYRPDRLGSFGFPATELLESIGQGRSLAVAGVSADCNGVWVELGPGRLAEIRGALVTTDRGFALSKLNWSAFSPGDRIGVRPAESVEGARGWETGHGHLVLSSWVPSLTGALPRDDRNARMLLPLRKVDRQGGALHLAGERQGLVYPMALSQLPNWRDVSAVWLDARNDVEPFVEGSIQPGDTALLGVTEGGRLTLSGLPGVEVRIAPKEERNWPGSAWLYFALSQEHSRSDLLTSMGQQLPVTVHSVGISRPMVTVSREHQPSGRWPRGCQVRTEVIAAQGQRLLLRSGGALHAVHVGQAVAGIPAALAESVAATLSDSARTGPLVLWWLIDDQGGCTAGLVEHTAEHSARNMTVVPEYEVTMNGTVVGAVCRDLATLRLHWMNAEHVGWIQTFAAGDLMANLLLDGPVAARLRPDASLSVNERPALTHLLHRLRLGQPLRVVVGKGDPQPTPSGRWRYIVRLEVPSVLMSYESPDPALTPGSSRFTEVDRIDRVGRPEVTTVDANSRLVTLDLPRWLLEAHQSIADGRPPAAEASRFGTYRRWYEQGPAAGPLSEDPVEGILRLAGNLLESGTAVDAGHILDCTRRWLTAHGRSAFNLVDEVEMDAAPLLAGALALDALAETDDRWEQGVVLCLHQLGRRAAASLHAEQFATAWINRPERHALGGGWVRLRSLSLARQLSPREARQLREFCRAMLIKPALRTAERDLAPIARSLLAAIGDLESAQELLRDATVLAGPAIWARTLLPPAGQAVAQARLLPSQRQQLRAVAEHVIHDEVPLRLLPVVAPPSSVERKGAQELLRWAREIDGDRT
ncbi:hypothetical protein ACIRJR_32690 [Streptomyces sp. NPDC102402]|uniref:hypothetical protein n=1 Tax=Streptomyces sp. NPDC102402 TaxID=3366169 RepID=UPI00382AEB87